MKWKNYIRSSAHNSISNPSSTDKVDKNISKQILESLELPDDHITLTPAHILSIIEWVTEKNLLTFGSEAEIYRIPIYLNKEKTKAKQFLVAKKRFDNETAHEYDIHKKVYKLLENRNTGVKVPQLLAKYEHVDGTQLIIMEYIKWKTIYARIVDILVNKYLAPHADFRVPINNDRDADKALTQYFTPQKAREIIDMIIYNPTEFTSTKKLKNIIKHMWLPNIIPNDDKITLFSKEHANTLATKLESFFTLIHKHGLYHRDIGHNIRNIIIGDNWVPYVIDFWKAKEMKESKKHKDIYYTNGGKTASYSEDEEIINIINQFS